MLVRKDIDAQTKTKNTDKQRTDKIMQKIRSKTEKDKTIMKKLFPLLVN